MLSAAAAVAAVAALALGLWATTLSSDLDDARGELAVLSDPNAQTHETGDGEASLVVTPTGDAALVVRELDAAPGGQGLPDLGLRGRDAATGRPVRGARRHAVLTRPVTGAQVAVTLEADGGVEAPTGAPLFSTAT